MLQERSFITIDMYYAYGKTFIASLGLLDIESLIMRALGTRMNFFCFFLYHKSELKKVVICKLL